MYLEKQNGHSLLVQAIFFCVFFFPGTGGVVFTILDVVELEYICVISGRATAAASLPLRLWASWD